MPCNNVDINPFKNILCRLTVFLCFSGNQMNKKKRKTKPEAQFSIPNPGFFQEVLAL